MATETLSAGTISSSTAFQNGGTYTPSVEKNVLYGYRSWNYNFVLGALPPEVLNGRTTPLEVSNSIEKFTVLSSTGKGTRPMGVSTDLSESSSTNAQNLINGFQKDSPGHFDLYIDNVVIDGVATCGTTQAGSTQATTMSFEVYEPYSMNGFVEALQVAAQAAGYTNYVNGVFALRVQFHGWPDGQDVASSVPEVIPHTTRYFCIKITGVEVDVSESGTRYRCQAVAYNQLVFGTPNKLTNELKVSGNHVWEVLQNFFKAVNDMAMNDAISATGSPLCDQYEISCPKLAVPGTPEDVMGAMLYSPVKGRETNGPPNSSQSEIILAKMNEELKGANVFQLADPSTVKNGYAASRPSGVVTGTPANVPAATTDPATGKLIPKDGTVVYNNRAEIHNCITSIVRDSEYVRNNVLKTQLEKAKKNNSLMVTYFTIRVECDIGSYDPVRNKYFSIWRYILEPYQMPYTKIPGQEQGEVDHSVILKEIKRSYDYIYTGNNLDIVKFQLQFNHLYYSAFSPKGANEPENANPTQQGAPSNPVVVLQPGSNAAATNNGANTLAATTRDIDSSLNSYDVQATGGQQQSDPYYNMAQAFHTAILNNVDMITGTLDILGDPYFLVSDGMGNSDLSLESVYQTTDKSAPIHQGFLYINVNFTNPIDINTDISGPTGGLARFDNRLLPFSGLYQITTLKNTFRGGIFTQQLDILRTPGQVRSGSSTKPNDFILQPNTTPGSQLTTDSASPLVSREGFRPSSLSLSNLVDRGLPNIGLPGVGSNFTGALTGEAGGILRQVSGATGISDLLTNSMGVDPLGGFNPLTSGIKFSPSSFSSLAGPTNFSAAAIGAAGNNISSIVNINNASVDLANNVSSIIPTTADSINLPQDVMSLGSNFQSQVGGASDAINLVQNSIPTDASGIASKLGIDPSSLSGLDPSLASKVTGNLSELAQSIPNNIDIGSLEKQGVVFSNIKGGQLGNLPAAQPKVSAPDPLPDPAFNGIVNDFGSVSSLLDGQVNLPPLTDINKVTNPMGSITAGLSGGLNPDQIISDQINSIQGQVGSVVNPSLGVTNPVGSLVQNNITRINPADVGLGSIESNINANAGMAQVKSVISDISSAPTVSSKYGSLQTQSPLARLIRNSNIQGSV